MSISFDSALGIQPHALAMRARRTEMLANNLANADTPGYLARDLDFKTAFEEAGRDVLRMTRSDRSHLDDAVTDSSFADMKYRVPTQPSVDGNTVDGDQEMALFAQNRVAFETAFTLLNGRFRTLASAIRGE